jgi:lysophospholipase L1-like esterase
VNLGISGDRTQHVLWRLDNGNVDGIRPRVAVLMIGTNNSADDRNTAPEMVQGIRAVVQKIRDKMPDTRILLLGIFPRGADFNPQRGKILQVNQVIRNLDDGVTVHYLDIGHLFVDADGKIPKDVMNDSLHLTPRGYQMWAEAIEPKLRQLLGEAADLASVAPSGEWTFEIRGPSGEQMELTMSLSVEGEKVSGTIATDTRQLAVENGRLAGNQISFTVRRVRSSGDVMVYEVQGTVEADLMKGTVNAVSEGQTVEWSARRRK